eukprot:Gb_23678 [translate_table: standard]
MASLDLAPSFSPSYSSYLPHASDKSTNDKSINYQLSFNDVCVYAGRIHQTADAIETIPLQIQKPNWKLEGRNANRSADNNFEGVASLLQACTNIKQLEQIHAHIFRSAQDHNVFLATKLVRLYAMFNSIDNARLVFNRVQKQNFFLWNEMIRGYAMNEPYEEALVLYYQMQQTGIQPNNFTFSFVLKACAGMSALEEGKAIHDHIARSPFKSNVFVLTALIDMYAKCGSVEIARQLFDRLSRRDVVAWSAMIAGYAQNGYADEALALFHQMQVGNVKPNSVTMVSVLTACAQLGALQQGKWIHEYIVRRGFESDVIVGTALIDMYVKCGSVEIARHMFDKMPERNVFTWSAMIVGYGMNGYGKDALELFGQMLQTGMKPNDITFIGVLYACSHAGLVNEGWQYFDCTRRDYGITPSEEHYACMVDLLGRAGHLEKARVFIENMPVEPGPSVWGALLGACRIHCNTELGEHVAERLFELQPENTGFYVLLSNIYAAAGRWDDVERVRAMMRDRGLKKPPGLSLIEVDNRIHAFIAGDESHPQSGKIYAMLQNLTGQMKEAGYVPDINFVLRDVEEEVKERMLYSHSEKLAIAFGLINTRPGNPICITKNIRVCGDCHTATKFISKIVKREIIVRDANRFHHFRDGLCSCGDYW